MSRTTAPKANTAAAGLRFLILATHGVETDE